MLNVQVLQLVINRTEFVGKSPFQSRGRTNIAKDTEKFTERKEPALEEVGGR